MTLQSSRLGQTIAKARQKAGLTQQELAGAIILAQSTLADIERGASPGSRPTLRRIAKRLELDFAGLMRLRASMIAERSAPKT